MPKINSVEKSFIIKIIGLIAIFIICGIVGNVALLGMAVIGGMELSLNIDIFSELSNDALRPFIKAGVGFNHLAMFTLSSLWFAYWIKGRSWLSYFERNEVDADLLLKFVLLLICAMPIIGGSATVLENVDLPEWANSMDESSIESLIQLLSMDSIWGLMFNLIIVALLPAVGEELLFRGVIQNELVQKMKNPHVAIFLASFIFSAFHLQVQGFLPKMIIGLILGYAYYWTKSIYYPMVIHFLNNGLQTVLMYVAGDQLSQLEEESIEPENGFLWIGVVISCFLCYFIIQSILKTIDKKESKIV